MFILGILFKEGEVSANKILLLLPRTQAPERLKMFLIQLEEKGKITILARDNIRKGLKTYMITQSGKETVQSYLSAGYKNIAGVFTSPAVEKDSERFWDKIRGLYPTHNTE
jgi:DNA-binding PadR family transcriptional regulator